MPAKATAAPVSSQSAQTKGQADGFTAQPIGTGTEEKKSKRVKWGTRDGDGKLIAKLTSPELPEGFDTRASFPLRRDDFERIADFYEYSARRAEATAIRLRKQAEDEKSMPSGADRKALRKAKNLMEKFETLKKGFKDAGMTDEQTAAFLNG